MVHGFPLHTRRHEVDAAGIFAVRTPRVSNVIKIIRTENMPAGAPADAVTFVGHAHGSEADRVDGRHDPADMMKAGPVGFQKRHHVMITAVNAVEKSDLICRAVREAHAENARVEIDRPIDVWRETKDVREPLDAWVPGVAAVRSIAYSGQQGSRFDRRYRIWGCLRPDANLRKKSVMIVKPDSIRYETFWWIDLWNSAPGEACLEFRKIFLETQE